MSTILVIDDDLDLAECLRYTLESAGFNAFAAKDGVEGIQLVRNRQPDLVLCDIEMPLASGYAVLDAMQQDPVTADIPVIFITGHSEARKKLARGAENCLPKPVGVAELITAIEDCLRRQNRQKQREAEFARQTVMDVAHMITHELRIPIAKLNPIADLLNEAAQGGNPGRVMLLSDILRTNSMQLNRVSERFVLYFELYSRILEGSRCKIVPGNKDISVPAYLRAEIMAAKAWRAENLEKQGTAFVSMEVHHLEALVEELVHNALKFSEMGTPVRLQIAQTPKNLTITVSDQGRGMTDDEIGSIRLLRKTKRLYFEKHGFGLGLGIVQLITELYGGNLIIQSKQNQASHGATIRVELPLFQAQNQCGSDVNGSTVL